MDIFDDNSLLNKLLKTNNNRKEQLKLISNNITDNSINIIIIYANKYFDNNSSIMFTWLIEIFKYKNVHYNIEYIMDKNKIFQYSLPVLRLNNFFFIEDDIIELVLKIFYNHEGYNKYDILDSNVPDIFILNLLLKYLNHNINKKLKTKILSFINNYFTKDNNYDNRNLFTITNNYIKYNYELSNNSDKFIINILLIKSISKHNKHITFKKNIALDTLNDIKIIKNYESFKIYYSNIIQPIQKNDHPKFSVFGISFIISSFIVYTLFIDKKIKFN